jgi:hypothetical protein
MSMTKNGKVTALDEPSVVQGLKEKLVVAMQRVLQNNKEELSAKVLKVVRKSAKKILKVTSRKKAKWAEAAAKSGL